MKKIRFLFTACMTVLAVQASVFAEDSKDPANDGWTESSSSKAFGKAIRANASAGAIESEAQDVTGLRAGFDYQLLGKSRDLLAVQAQMNDLLEGESEFYWSGLRVASSKPKWENGALTWSAELPSILMRIPVASVPLGPITVRLDAGVGAEASIEARLLPEITIPIQFMSVSAQLAPEVQARAFVEGYAKFLVLRGGIGGELELIRAKAALQGRVYLQQKPQIAFSGFISFLKGQFYGFIDHFNFLSWKWKRDWKPSLYSWDGKCIPLGSAASGSAQIGQGVDSCSS